jgi:basic amino acid/polyamine antiporter, APA family
MQSETEPASSPQLVRGLGLRSATILNMIDMIGVGPFITIPLIVSAMGGPQAMIGWILGALFAFCDGLVWAELGAAMPAAGGSYKYISEIYGPRKLGRLMSFLFVWQLSFSAPLSVATGCVGLAQYAAYVFPRMERTWFARDFSTAVPGLGPLEAHIAAGPGTVLAITACALIVFLLYRRITAIARLSTWLGAGVLAMIAWIVFAGFTHFSAARAFSFPAGAFTLGPGFFAGLGAAMLMATYDYWGYYNVCFLGGEVKDAGRNIPRALLLSIVLVAALYLAMNISILGVLPWQELGQAAHSNARLYIASAFMQRIYGSWAAYAITFLVIGTAFSSVFSLLLGYSRVPYAAALDGNYFKAFARVHPRGHFPHVSLLSLGAMAAAFCFLRLVDIIAALVVIRIVIQFLVQAVGVMILRVRRPEMERPFRMWFYPLPALLAMGGFIFILLSRQNFMREVRYAVVILATGIGIFLVRSWRRAEWPFLRIGN